MVGWLVGFYQDVKNYDEFRETISIPNYVRYKNRSSESYTVTRSIFKESMY